MANTFSQIYLHLIFAVKGRNALLTPGVIHRVHSYMGGIIRDCGGRETSRTVSLPFAIKTPGISTLGFDLGGVVENTRDVTETLKYADAAIPAFNGNVGERVYGDASVSYRYDSHNRLTKATYTPTGAGSQENFSTEYSYDRHANLTRLKKYGLVEPTTGEFGLIDDLRLSYDGNQVVYVEDNGEDPVFEGAGGFNAPGGVGEMTYDANGNLFTDTSRGITRIEYSDLNLPTAIYWSDGHRQTITYDGRGVKLSVTYATATTDVLLDNGTYRRYRTDFVRRYGAGRVVRSDSVEMVMHPYGYIDGKGNIRYYLHDFQGNVTMVVDNEGEVLQHTRYYPYGEPIDVFAASAVSSTASATDRTQPYLYGGKELERMHGLGEYDYGARRFQSHLPMWTTQDPCLEKYFPTSPYAYCAGNPIRFTDPDGRAHYINNLTGEYLGTDGNNLTEEVFRLITKNEYESIQENQPDNIIESLEQASTKIEFKEIEITEKVLDEINNSLDDKLEHQIFIVLNTGTSEVSAVGGGSGKQDEVEMKTSEITFLDIRLLEDDRSNRPPFNIVIGQVHTHLDLTKSRKSKPVEGVSQKDINAALSSGLTIYAVDTFTSGNTVHMAKPNGSFYNNIGKTNLSTSYFRFGFNALKNYKR